MRRRLLAALLLALGASTMGCRDREEMFLIGRWEGTLSSVGSVGSGYDAEMQIYAGKRFKLILEDRLQRAELKGTWTREGQRVLLSAADFAFENPPEDEIKAKNLPVVGAEAFRSVFGRRFVLDHDAKTRELRGLTVQLGSREMRMMLKRDMRVDPGDRAIGN